MPNTKSLAHFLLVDFGGGCYLLLLLVTGGKQSQLLLCPTEVQLGMQVQSGVWQKDSGQTCRLLCPPEDATDKSLLPFSLQEQEQDSTSRLKIGLLIILKAPQIHLHHKNLPASWSTIYYEMVSKCFWSSNSIILITNIIRFRGSIQINLIHRKCVLSQDPLPKKISSPW